MTAIRMKNLGELALPGAGIGASAGVVAGGLALLVGQPAGWAVVTTVALGLPMTLFGGGFGLLLGAGIVQPGVFAPVGLYWLVAFPVARLLHEVLAGLLMAGRPVLPADLLGFLAYQAMVSLGFAVGFSWLHERIVPGLLRRIRGHNPPAERLYTVYVRHAEVQWRTRESRRQARRPGRGAGSESLFRTKGES